MRLTTYDPEMLKRMAKHTPLEKICHGFREANMACAVLEDWEGSSATNKANSIRQALKRLGYLGTTAIARDGKVYLIREELLK